jgi:hypothetical protein
MSLERDDTDEFSIPPTQDQQQGTADTRARVSPRAAATSANSPGVSEATSQEISRGTSSAHTTRAEDTYGGNPERRARARGTNSSEIPLPQKGTPNSFEGAEPNSGNSDLSSENPGKTRSMNITHIPDGSNISNVPNYSTSKPGTGSHAQITGTDVNVSTLPAGYDTSTTNSSTLWGSPPGLWLVRSQNLWTNRILKVSTRA